MGFSAPTGQGLFQLGRKFTARPNQVAARFTSRLQSRRIDVRSETDDMRCRGQSFQTLHQMNDVEPRKMKVDHHARRNFSFDERLKVDVIPNLPDRNLQTSTGTDDSAGKYQVVAKYQVHG